jgi:hypothetical protein
MIPSMVMGFMKNKLNDADHEVPNPSRILIFNQLAWSYPSWNLDVLFLLRQQFFQSKPG